MYKFADGQDNVAGLIPISPQPRSEGLISGRITEALDGDEFEDGFLHIELLYSILTAEDFESLCSFFGVSRTTRVNEGTFSLPVDDSGRDFSNFNGKIYYPILPDDGKYHYWWTDVIFRVKRLRIIA